MSFSAQDLIKNAMLGGRGGSGSSVQADWNQTDETAPDFIRNKPFYKEQTLADIIPETSVSADENGEYAIIAENPIYGGNNYIVIWNGKEYNSSSVNSELYDMDVVILGNSGALLGGDDTGEPFAVIYVELLGTHMVYPLDGSAEINIAVRGVVETTKQLDSEFYSVFATVYVLYDDNVAGKCLYHDMLGQNKVTRESDFSNGRFNRQG